MQSKSGLGKIMRVAMSAAALAALTAAGAQAQTFNVFQNFNGSNGGNPDNGLIMNAGGDLFGTASTGGTSSLGVVFEVTGKNNETVLYNFAGGTTDGATPNGNLIADLGGNLYGTTTAGGTAGARTSSSDKLAAMASLTV